LTFSDTPFVMEIRAWPLFSTLVLLLALGIFLPLWDLGAAAQGKAG